MKCKNCGKELQSNMTVCDACSAPVSQKKDNKKKIIGIVVGCVCLVVAAVLILSGALSAGEKAGGSDKYVDMVQEGSLYYFPDETVEEAFDDFFADPEWKSFVSEDDDRIVEFNGTCEYYGKDENLCMQFTVDEETGEFEITYVDIAGESFGDEDLEYILDTIFSDSPKAGDTDKYVDIVQEGSMYYFPDETVEDAFNDFFAYPEWKSFVSEAGDRIVEFNGTCEYYGEDENLCMQFVVDEETGEFEIIYVDIAGESFEYEDLDYILDTIFSE